MPSTDLSVTGGQLLLDGELKDATLGVTDGSISHIVDPSVSLDADERLALDGEVVLPGLVDGHVHFREPGYTEKEGVETGTAAAAAGGVTTVIEMPNTVPPVLTVDRFESKADIFRSKSHVDFALFGAITEENVGTGDIAALADAGATAFKTFMATSFGPLLMDDKGELYRAFERSPTLTDRCTSTQRTRSISTSSGTERKRNTAKTWPRSSPHAHRSPRRRPFRMCWTSSRILARKPSSSTRRPQRRLIECEMRKPPTSPSGRR